MNKKYFLIAGLVFFIVIIFSQINARYKGKIMHRKFYSISISGKISKISVSTGTTFITINGIKYGFWPITNELNSNNIFSHTAKIGDSIFKPTYCDTLKLITYNKEYLYTFKKND
jgi:hypothetical protein